ncbi:MULTISPECIES: disulfide bond formation protein B [unclassified Moraxella]|uniref:disulfide bond formation protein B n=1 Tax=unclassified Moraxella TaxID=2685852 RepID=UPI003AF7C7B3
MNPSVFQRLTSFRGLAGLLSLGSIIGMAFAYFYLQGVEKLDPCPLCIFQRVGLIIMGIFALIAFIFNPKNIKARLALMGGAMLGMLWSIGVAIRHIWIQHLPPDQVPSCGPGLDYWMDTLPIAQVFTEVFRGSGECAVIDWTFLGFSIPQLSLAFFSVLFAMIIMAMLKAKQ